MRARATVVAVLACIWLGLGVASLAGAATPAKKIDACTLITPDDISEVLGIAGATKNEEVSASAPSFCAYNLPGNGLLTVGVGKYTKVTKSDFAVNSEQEGAQKIPGVKKGFYIVADATRPEGSEADVVIGKKFLVIQVLTVVVEEAAFLELINLAIDRV